jgi:hypothetical protein
MVMVSPMWHVPTDRLPIDFPDNRVRQWADNLPAWADNAEHLQSQSIHYRAPIEGKSCTATTICTLRRVDLPPRVEGPELIMQACMAIVASITLNAFSSSQCLHHVIYVYQPWGAPPLSPPRPISVDTVVPRPSLRKVRAPSKHTVDAMSSVGITPAPREARNELLTPAHSTPQMARRKFKCFEEFVCQLFLCIGDQG